MVKDTKDKVSVWAIIWAVVPHGPLKDNLPTGLWTTGLKPTAVEDEETRKHLWFWRNGIKAVDQGYFVWLWKVDQKSVVFLSFNSFEKLTNQKI